MRILQRFRSLSNPVLTGFHRNAETQSVVYRAASTTSKPVKKRLEDLSNRAIGPDGHPSLPLPSFEANTPRGSKRLKGKGKATRLNAISEPVSAINLNPTQHKEWLRLVDTGIYPDTALAREIYANRITYPDDLLLTRVGMFYESYFDQAATVASLLGIRLTSKKFSRKPSGIQPQDSSNIKPPLSSFPFSGFPCHASSTYFRRLLDQNRSFVVVEELEDKSAAKNDAKTRFVSRKYTPGTMLSESWQATDENRYLMGIAVDRESDMGADGAKRNARDTKVGLAYIDISTDRAMMTKSSTLGELEHELARVAPVEIVIRDQREGDAPPVTEEKAEKILSETLRLSGIYISTSPKAALAVDSSDFLPRLERQAVEIAQAHLSECLLQDMPTLLPPNHLSESRVMQIDASTLLGLEVRQSLRQSVGGRSGGLHSSPISRAGTLLSVIKRTLTPSGTRKLVNVLCQPSAHLPTIQKRHDLVEAFFVRPHLREDMRDLLRSMSLKARGSASGNGGEIGRTVQKYLGRQGKAPLVGNNGVSDGRDLWDLKQTVEDISSLGTRISEELEAESGRCANNGPLQQLRDSLLDLSDLTTRIDGAVTESALNKAVSSTEEISADLGPEEEPSPTQDVLSIAEQKAADREAQCFSQDLQDAHDRVTALHKEQAIMQRALQERYDSTSMELKSGLSGFHVHMMKKDATSSAIGDSVELVPLTQSKSTRTFQYAPWTTLGVQIVDANKVVGEVQREAFEVLRAEICARQLDLLTNAEILSEIDLTLGFAQVAEELRWVKPDMHESFETTIEGGRHPMVEHGLVSSQQSRNFVPNSLHMDQGSFLHLISGPNQGGKSTTLRQTAIIAILAQAGSFVPAKSAKLGIADAVFSRVGARDDLYQDKSTFMMEMSETAYILRRATKRSIVIMDEIGRGTTLLSGIAIAYATLDHILLHIGCRTLFATHYHELVDMLTESRTDGKGSSARKGVEFWCTDIEEGVGQFSYAYKLRRGVNRRSHAMKVARQAGVPASFLSTAESVLEQLEQERHH